MIWCKMQQCCTIDTIVRLAQRLYHHSQDFRGLIFPCLSLWRLASRCVLHRSQSLSLSPRELSDILWLKDLFLTPGTWHNLCPDNHLELWVKPGMALWGMGPFGILSQGRMPSEQKRSNANGSIKKVPSLWLKHCARRLLQGRDLVADEGGRFLARDCTAQQIAEAKAMGKATSRNGSERGVAKTWRNQATR